jgi:DNA repair exonuclease SbcCD ATPase subunit
MRIGPVILHNFGPFEHVEFDLSKPGLTGIEGVMHDRPGCTSNGSGKSMLIEGVSWVCFDRVLRERYGKDDLIRLQFKANGGNKLALRTDGNGSPIRPSDGCYGIVHVVGGSVDIRIERYRGHAVEGNKVKLFIGGKDVTRGRDSMTNLAIEQTLGMDFRAFISSIAFGAREDVKGFFAATDSERKATLDKLLGMEVYAQAQKRARVRLAAVAEKLSASERKRASLEARCQDQQKTLDELLGQDDGEVELRWKKARASVVLAERQLERLREEVVEAEADVAQEEQAAEVIREAHAKAVRAHKERRREIEAERRAKEDLRAQHRSDARVGEQDLATWQSLGGKNCPTCLQVVPKTLALRAQRAALAKRDTAQDAAEAAAKDAQALEEALSRLGEPPEPPQLWLLEGAKEVLRQRREAVAAQERDVAVAQSEARAAAREKERAAQQREAIQARLSEMLAEIEKLTADSAQDALEADRLEFWVDGFGAGGLRSFLIEAEIPEINRAASRYAQRLLGPGATVQMSATRQLKGGDTREELDVRATIPGCTVTYPGASKGQKRRLDLSLLLAFREIVGRRYAKKFAQLFADELFDGLDDAGEDSVVELLREISATCPVALVTHSDALKASADRLLVVHHKNGVATLEDA